MLLVIHDKDPIFKQPGFNMGAGEILHIPTKPTRIYMSSQEGQVCCFFVNQRPKINNRKKTKQKVTTTKTTNNKKGQQK